VQRHRHFYVFLRRKVCQQVVALEDKAHLVEPHLGERILRQGDDVFAVHAHVPPARLFQSADDVEQRGLARAARPHQTDHLAARHVGKQTYQPVTASDPTLPVAASFIPHLDTTNDLAFSRPPERPSAE